MAFHNVEDAVSSHLESNNGASVTCYKIAFSLLQIPIFANFQLFKTLTEQNFANVFRCVVCCVACVKKLLYIHGISPYLLFFTLFTMCCAYALATFTPVTLSIAANIALLLTSQMVGCSPKRTSIPQ